MEGRRAGGRIKAEAGRRLTRLNSHHQVRHWSTTYIIITWKVLKHLHTAAAAVAAPINARDSFLLPGQRVHLHRFMLIYYTERFYTDTMTLFPLFLLFLLFVLFPTSSSKIYAVFFFFLSLLGCCCYCSGGDSLYARGEAIAKQKSKLTGVVVVAAVLLYVNSAVSHADRHRHRRFRLFACFVVVL
jgi:hypothetical protein